MSLRLRLIVAFFFLSVVPLAAVTLYTYTSNVEAVRDAAGHGAELLAGELTQRMELVMVQLGQRVERLMDITSAAEDTRAEAAAARPGPAPAAASPATVTASAAASDAAIGTQQAAAALGDLAMLINNVELRGLRGRGGRRGGGGGGFPGGGRGGPDSPQGAPLPPGPPVAPSAPSASATPSTAPPPSSGTGAGRSPGSGQAATAGPQGAVPAASVAPASGQGTQPDPARGGDPNAPGANPDRGRFRGGFRGEGGPPPDASATGRGTGPDGRQGGFGPPPGPRIGPPGAPPVDANADPNRILIDLGPTRDEIIRQLVPDGRVDLLSPEERARIFAEVNQRMQGIQQGIQLLQEKVAERVADAKAATTNSVPPAPAKQASPAAAAPAPAASTPAAATAPVNAGKKRSTEISGSHLAVRVEQNGQVVGQASAEINLPALTATVFLTTRRDRGEVPFAVAKDGKLYTPTAADKQTIEALGSKAIRSDTPPGTEVLPEWIVVTTDDPSGSGLKFGIARPFGDALADLQSTTVRNALFGLGFIGIALIGIVPLSNRLTKNLSQLSEGVRRIAAGEYHARVDVHASDEVGRLAKAFNKMAADVEAHQRSVVEQERIRRELELGRQIQHDMLPHVPLRLGLTEIKGVSVPAREVGGDFFNYFQLTNGTVALLVGDVSGKGVGAALLMANIQASLRTRLALGQDLASLAIELDRDIESSTPGPVYATLFVGIFDPATRVLRCVNAGHNPQYVLRPSGLERMESTGLPIGLLSGRGYTDQRVQLAAGDLLFFYTDGCVEAENAAGDMFGPERLEAALLAARTGSADDVLLSVETEVSRFRAERELGDDATMMVVKVG